MKNQLLDYIRSPYARFFSYEYFSYSNQVIVNKASEIKAKKKIDHYILIPTFIRKVQPIVSGLQKDHDYPPSWMSKD